MDAAPTFRHVETLHTSASPERIWALWSNIATWPTWDPPVEKVVLDGPFRVGTTGHMVMAGGFEMPFELEVVHPDERYLDVLRMGELGIRVDHVVEAAEGGSLVSSGTRLGGGTLAYSSWETMNRIGTSDPVVCSFNDFALVKVAGSDVSKVNPSIPFWGGPTGIDTDGLGAGESVWSYGNSSLRGGIELLSPKQGISLGDDAADQGWSHLLYTVTPGVPGDSGSAFLSADGKAVGTLSTLGLTPFPLSNNIGDLAQELAFAQQHSGIPGLKLALGTEPFSPLL